MIFTLILIDIIFMKILNFPIYITFLIFIFSPRIKFLIPLCVAVVLDIIFFKIHLSLFMLILFLLRKKLFNLNNLKKLIFLNLIYLGIYFWFDSFKIITLLKIIIINIIYILVLKIPLEKYKLIGDY